MENKVRVLAIDDNVMQLKEYDSLLAGEYDLRVVKSSSEAISFINAQEVDVILLDIEMPHISGFQFLKDIKRIPSYMKVPVIIVSGNSGPEFMAKVKESPADDVLIKPVRRESLIQTIQKVLAAVEK